MFDATATVAWGNLSYDAQVPDSTTLTVAVRGGATPTPDGSWTAWTTVTNNSDIPATSRYLQYRATLGTSNSALTPVLQEVRIAVSGPPPANQAPSVTNPGAQTGTVGIPLSLPITATDPDDDTITYSSIGLPTGLTIHPDTGVISGTPTADGVFNPTITASDGHLSGNAAFAWTIAPAPPPNSLTDTTVADFGLGVTASTVVTDVGGGEVTLSPTVNEEFNGSAVPAGWEAATWNPGGSATVAGGSLAVDGAYARTTALHSPGHVLEFRATFGAGTFQNAGFGLDLNAFRWAMFGIGDTADQLYARVSGQADVPLGNLLGSPHTYRIEWESSATRFYVDGTLRHTATSITDVMRPIASDFNTGAPGLSVDWLRMSPYAAGGTFTSRVFDAGSNADWGFLSYQALTPAGTSLSLEVRTGDVATPDDSWSSWTSVANGGAIPGVDPFAQYRGAFGTTNPDRSAVLEQVTLSYADGDPIPNRAPTVADPGDQEDTVGDVVSVAMSATDPDGDSLTFSATGLPAGLAINTSTGVISGEPTTVGQFSVTVVADDGSLTDDAAFVWTVAAPPIPSSLVDTTTADFNAGDALLHDRDVH